jgi:putative FmdB family regulatory protein
MPIYDYQCSSCGHKAEVMRKISAANIEVCPECGAETFSKQLSAPSFQLSGSGWYATDFKNGTNNSPNKDASSTGSSDKSAGTKSEVASESKSETKSEAAPAACSTGCACH